MPVALLDKLGKRKQRVYEGRYGCTYWLNIGVFVARDGDTRQCCHERTRES